MMKSIRDEGKRSCVTTSTGDEMGWTPETSRSRSRPEEMEGSKLCLKRTSTDSTVNTRNNNSKYNGNNYSDKLINRNNGYTYSKNMSDNNGRSNNNSIVVSNGGTTILVLIALTTTPRRKVPND